MSTFVHGIGASENIDSSGEIVSIAGLDISSLDKDGVLNWEHKSDTPAQVVGKILKARKIFTDADCEDENQLYFWNKCKVPYLYIMGELLDEYSDSAREVAGKFRYDNDKKNQNERALMNFSVEGSKIAKEGITVTRSIARKITITILPCNKAAVAEMIVVDAKPKKGNIDELFKTEAIEIEVLQVDSNSKLWELLKKEDPNKHAAKLGITPFKKDMAGGAISGGASSALSGVGPTSAAGVASGGMALSEKLNKKEVHGPKDSGVHARGNKIGITQSGHGIFSHGMIGDYSHFSSQDHADAHAAHTNMANNPATPAHLKSHYVGKASLHQGRSKSLGAKAVRQTAPAKPKASIPPQTGAKTLASTNKLYDPGLSGLARKSEDWSGKEASKVEHRRTDVGQTRTNEVLKHPPHAPEVDRPRNGSKQMQPKRIHRTSEQNMPKSEMHKALTAGSGLAAPDRLEGGAALGKENLKKDFANPANQKRNDKVNRLQREVDSGTYKPDSKKIATGMLGHPDKPLKGTKVQKSQALMRAEHHYDNWGKREEFETFMKSRMPSLTKTQIRVIGQTMLLQKSLNQEKSLSKIAPSEFQHSFINKKETK